MEAVEAFSHPCWEVQRLPELAAEWPAKQNRSPSRRQSFRPFKLEDLVDGELVARLVAEYEAGTPTTELMKRFDLGKGSVIKLLREAGVRMRRQGMKDVQIIEAVSLYESGLSLEAVGRQLSVHPSTVWLALKQRGVPMRGPHHRRR